MKKSYLLFLCLFSVLSAFAQAPDENRFVKTVLVEKLDEPMVMAYLVENEYNFYPYPVLFYKLLNIRF